MSFVERPFGRSGGNTPEMRTIKDLNITINGRRVPIDDFPAAGSSLETNASTQSMLLVSEGSAYSRHSDAAGLPRPRDVEEESFDQGSMNLSRIQKPTICSIFPKLPADSELTPQLASPGVKKASADGQVPSVNHSLLSTTQHYNSADENQISSNRRRFTIDDQIDQMIAENERRLNATKRVARTSREPNQEPQDQLYHDSILSPRTLGKSDCYSRKPEFHLEHDISPSGKRLPQPLYVIKPALHNLASPEKGLIKSSETVFSWSSSDVYTPPTKIFGQSVVLENSNFGPECLTRNQDSKTSNPNSSVRSIPTAENRLTEIKSLGTVPFDLTQHLGTQNQMIVRTQKPTHRPNHAFLTDRPVTASCSPGTQFQLSARHEQCTPRHVDEPASLLVQSVSYRDGQPSIDRNQAYNTSSPDPLSFQY